MFFNGKPLPESQGMTDDELIAVLDSEIASSVGYTNGGTISDERAAALDRYYGRPYGNEQEGRSSVVSTDVSDTIESMLPDLVKIFVSGDQVVSFEPAQPDDEELAKQETDGVNYVFTKENNALMIVYTWLKDGLLQKNGFVKAFWDKRTKTTEEQYQGLTEEELSILMSDHSVQVIGQEARPDDSQQPDPNAPPAMLYDVRIRRTINKGGVKIINIPPEQFLISRGATCIEDARMVGHRELKTSSDLLEMGIPPEVVQNIPTDDWRRNTEEEIARWQDEDFVPGSGNVSTLDQSTRQIWVTEAYLKVDYDGDGIAELRRILYAGNKILENEAWDEVPEVSFTPIPMPHQFFGRAVADLVIPTQLVKTTLKRQMLDNTYLVNAPGYVVQRTAQVDLDALLNRVPGGVVLAGDVNAVKPLETSALPQSTFSMYEMETSDNEARTGQTRYNQGLDSNTLNKTKGGMEIITGKADLRKELVARIFAESLTQLFRLILHLMIKHQDKAKTIRIRDKWVNIDPRTWNAEMDVTINVGLGTGSKEQQAQLLLGLFNTQMQANQVIPGLAGAENIYNTLARYVENVGLKSPGTYFTDPKELQAQQANQPPQPDPAVQQQQAELQLKERLGMEEIASKERMKALELQHKSHDGARMAEAASKPATTVQFDAQGKLDEVAQSLAVIGQNQTQMSMENTQIIQQAAVMMAQAAEAIGAAMQQMNLPKKVIYQNGRPVGIAPVQ